MRLGSTSTYFAVWALSLGGAVHCGGSEDGPASGRPSYERLSETGLYADLASRAPSRGVLAFAPSFTLWSDAADKSRWLALPAGTSVDTSDMDHWVFPIGTRVWKEFSLEGRPLETRLIERYGPERDDYWMGAFLWEADGSDAVLADLGSRDVLGTQHDVPAQDQCPSCHNGEAGRVLGFSALQLAGEREEPLVTLSTLSDDGLLSALPANAAYVPPGDATASAALGYLHANCGHCHNPRGTAWPDTQMSLRLGVGEAVAGAPASTSGLFQSVVGQRLQYFRDDEQAVSLRVAPGRPDLSGLVVRMQVRGPMEQMPPLATERVDDAGVEIVSRWIESLSE